MSDISRRIIPLRLPPDSKFMFHLINEERGDRFSKEDSNSFKAWIRTKPFVCTGRWFIRFSDGSIVVGDGSELKTTLLPGKIPYDDSINLRSSGFKKLLDNHLNPKKEFAK